MGASGSSGAAAGTAYTPPASATATGGGGFNSSAAASKAAPYAGSVSYDQGSGFVPKATANTAGANSQYGGMLGSLSNFFGGMGSGMSGQQVPATGARGAGANFGQALGASMGAYYSQPATVAQSAPIPQQQPQQQPAPAANMGGGGGSGVSGVAAQGIQSQGGQYFSNAASAVPDYVGMMQSMGGGGMGGGGMGGGGQGGKKDNSGRNSAIGGAVGTVAGAAVGAAFGGAGAGIGATVGGSLGGAVGGMVK